MQAKQAEMLQKCRSSEGNLQANGKLDGILIIRQLLEGPGTKMKPHLNEPRDGCTTQAHTILCLQPADSLSRPHSETL